MGLLDRILGPRRGARALDASQQATAAAAKRKAAAREIGRALEGLAYDGASVRRRANGWPVRSADPVLEVSSGQSLLIARSRDLCANNPWGRKARSAFVTAVVGGGIWPHIDTGKDKLDREIEEAFHAWASECLAGSRLGWVGLLRLAVGAWYESGEVLIRRRRRTLEDGLAVPLQVQILEAEFLDASVTGTVEGRGGKAFAGVHVDGIGRTIGYWLLPEHPGGDYSGAAATFIPADAVAHLFEELRPGQVRGVPWNAAAVVKSYELRDYEEAELVRARMAACLSAFIMPGDLALGPDDNRISPAGDGAIVDVNGRKIDAITPGMVGILRGGMDVKFLQPTPAQGFDLFSKQVLLAIAAANLIPYALLTGDLTSVNYSSIQYGNLDYRTMVDQVRAAVVEPLLLRRLWGWFWESATVAGVFRDPRPGDRHYRDSVVQFIPPAWPTIDREKEAKADEAGLRNGSLTYTQMVRRSGRSLEAHIREITRERTMLEDAGISLPWMQPEAAAAPPEAPAAPDDDPDPSDP